MALIRLEHVSKRYGDRIALTDVSLSLDAGEWVFLVGPSGAGKTTLLRLVAFAERPTSGRVEAEPGLRRTIGSLGQEFRLLSDRSVYDNIALACQIAGIWGRDQIGDRVRPLLDEMGLRALEGLFPGDLSAGEKQRVALARALVRHPRILIADEPTGNLDPAAAAQIFSMMRQFRDRDTLVITATHVEEWTQRHPGRVIRLEQGYVRSDAPAPRVETGSLAQAREAGGA
ncbi:MAG: ATP-binding cassette domain-containing protein [Candidatus Latescibacteria bacterium]|nr:ATP-binding cassette domain-containing protein [Candidatus Latescibacterota bacterium]